MYFIYHKIIKYVDFESIIYIINLDVVLSFKILTNLILYFYLITELEFIFKEHILTNKRPLPNFLNTKDYSYQFFAKKKLQGGNGICPLGTTCSSIKLFFFSKKRVIVNSK